MSEAQEVQMQEKPVTKHQTQELTDLTSFNAYAVVTLSDSQQVNIQITSRHGIPADRAYQDFKEFVKLLDLCAVDSSVKFWDGKRSGLSEGSNGATAKPTNGSTSESADKPKRDYKKPLNNDEVPAELADTNEDVFAAEFDAFKILPQPDNKSTVEFWKDGLDFPVGAKMNKWKHDTIINALAKLTEQEIDPAKAAEYRIAGVQYWVKGNEFTITQGAKKGEKSHYKNLVLLKPAF